MLNKLVSDNIVAHPLKREFPLMWEKRGRNLKDKGERPQAAKTVGERFEHFLMVREASWPEAI